MNLESLAESPKASLPSPERPLANILGVGVHAVDLDSAVGIIESAIEKREKGYVCVTGVHGIMEAHRNPQVRRAMASAMLVVPDGMPTVWIGRSQGYSAMRRVFGPDLMLELCRRSVQRDYTHFLYGGKPGVADELASMLRRRFSNIHIAGTYTPPFRPLNVEEKTELRKQINLANPDYIWIGLSTPRQELFMAEHSEHLNCRVMLGVGAAFDLHTGRLKDSPGWLKNAGLQWLHRLYQEPTRLWKRYLINNSAFLAKLALQKLKLKAYELNQKP